jgi:predicted P-loop ATPase/GTPase
MKVLLEIEDQKADFIMELMKNFKFVKAEPISTYKANVYKNLKRSVEELNLVQEGKIKAFSAKNLLDEL